MAEGGQQSGPASEIARQTADRADRYADWLDKREPGDLVEEARSFARRRPGAFLLGATLAGVVVGRLTRGAVDAARADSGPTPQRAYGAPGYPEATYTGTLNTGTVAPPQPYDGPTGPGVPPAGPPSYDTPAPPLGYAPGERLGAGPDERLADPHRPGTGELR
jgi:hypothetical protein